MNQVVADTRPLRTHGLVADVMCHRRGARRKDRQIGATLALQFQLRLLQTLAQLIVADARSGYRRSIACLLESLDLRVAKPLQLPRRGRVVPVTIDDHLRLFSSRSRVRIAVRHWATLALGSRFCAIAAKNSRSCNS